MFINNLIVEIFLSLLRDINTKREHSLNEYVGFATNSFK